MSELCWRCREKFHLETTGVNYKKLSTKESAELDDVWLNKFPWVHCHHEPKEKPKCICEEKKKFGFSLMKKIADGKMERVNFCPECGRML